MTIFELGVKEGESFHLDSPPKPDYLPPITIKENDTIVSYSLAS